MCGVDKDVVMMIVSIIGAIDLVVGESTAGFQNRSKGKVPCGRVAMPNRE